MNLNFATILIDKMFFINKNLIYQLVEIMVYSVLGFYLMNCFSDLSYFHLNNADKLYFANDQIKNDIGEVFILFMKLSYFKI